MATTARFEWSALGIQISLSSVTPQRYANPHSLHCTIDLMQRSRSIDVEESEDAPVDILPKEVRLAEDAGTSVSILLLVS